MSVNDSFVMNAWYRKRTYCKLQNDSRWVSEFSRLMGMLVCKDDKGFGQRS